MSQQIGSLMKITQIILALFALFSVPAEAGKNKRKYEDILAEENKKKRSEVDIAKLQIKYSEILDFIAVPKHLPPERNLVNDIYDIVAKLSPEDNKHVFMKARLFFSLAQVLEQGISITRNPEFAIENYHIALKKFKTAYADIRTDNETRAKCRHKIMGIKYRLAKLACEAKNYQLAKSYLSFIIKLAEKYNDDDSKAMLANAIYDQNFLYVKKYLEPADWNQIAWNLDQLSMNVHLETKKRCNAFSYVTILCFTGQSTLYSRQSLKASLKDIARSHNYEAIFRANMTNILVKILEDEGSITSYAEALYYVRKTIHDARVPETHPAKFNAHLLKLALLGEEQKNTSDYCHSLRFVCEFKDTLNFNTSSSRYIADLRKQYVPKKVRFVVKDNKRKRPGFS